MSQFLESIGAESESGSTSISRKRSQVWLHFVEVDDEEGVKWAKCKHCSMKFVTGNNKGTNHLRRHIKKGCKEIDEEEKERFRLGKDGEKRLCGSISDGKRVGNHRSNWIASAANAIV